LGSHHLEFVTYTPQVTKFDIYLADP
jgi:hypothetical protein